MARVEAADSAKLVVCRDKAGEQEGSSIFQQYRIMVILCSRMSIASALIPSRHTVSRNRHDIEYV